MINSYIKKRKIWTYFPGTLRTSDDNNDKCINEPYLNYLIAFSLRRPISPTACLTTSLITNSNNMRIWSVLEKSI